MLVIESCLVLNSSMTDTELSNCTFIAERSYANFFRQIVGVSTIQPLRSPVLMLIFSFQVGTLTGANTLDVASVGIDLGLLTANLSLLTDAYQRVHDEVVIQQPVRSDGIRPDGSFGQHDGIIYNGNYGFDL